MGDILTQEELMNGIDIGLPLLHQYQQPLERVLQLYDQWYKGNNPNSEGLTGSDGLREKFSLHVLYEASAPELREALTQLFDESAAESGHSRKGDTLAYELRRVTIDERLVHEAYLGTVEGEINVRSRGLPLLRKIVSAQPGDRDMDQLQEAYDQDQMHPTLYHAFNQWTIVEAADEEGVHLWTPGRSYEDFTNYVLNNDLRIVSQRSDELRVLHHRLERDLTEEKFVLQLTR